MNSRRKFIKQASLATAAAALLPGFACASAKNGVVGIQLYTLRDLIPNDVTGVIEKVAQIGYKEVETYGYTAASKYWGMDAKAFKSLLDANGLKAPSGHFGLDDFIRTGDMEMLKPLVEGAAAIDMKYVTCPYLDQSLRASIDDYKKVAQRLNEAAGLCKQSGMQLAYHNHDFEFQKFNGKTGYEILLQETDANQVQFEMDLYWVVRAGYDPKTWFDKHPGRFVMWHVKDMDKDDNKLNTEVGNGKVDFKSIFKHAKLSGLKHTIVEQENFKIEPFSSIKKSFDYVNHQLL